MTSPLSDLETRRRILFVDDCLTIRTIGVDSLLVTIITNKGYRQAIERAFKFLLTRSQISVVDSMIIDVSQAESLTLTEIFRFANPKTHGYKRLAVLSKRFRLRLLFPLLVPCLNRVRYRIFKDLSSAIHWTRENRSLP